MMGWLWFLIGGFFLRIIDAVRGTASVTFSDCAGDKNGAARLFLQMQFDDGVGGMVCHVANPAELAFQVLTALQRAEFARKPVLAHGNVAVRTAGNGNGPAFCIGRIGRSWVIMTEGGGWDGLKTFGLVQRVYRLDFPECIKKACEWGIITEKQFKELERTQFRSLFLSFLLKLRRLGFPIPGEWVDITSIMGEVCVVGFKDGFNNVYLLEQSKGLVDGDKVIVNGVEMPFHRRLADAPPGRPALVEVSAGYGGWPILGLMQKGGPNKKGEWPDHFPDLYPGAEVTIEKI